MSLEEWLLLSISLLSLLAGVAILLGLLGAIFKIFYKTWWIWVLLIIFLVVVQWIEHLPSKQRVAGSNPADEAKLLDSSVGRAGGC